MGIGLTGSLECAIFGMHITIILILTYIACCVRVGAAPWKYFQLNARYFSDDQGIFSKLSMDQLIPERWRLFQAIDADSLVPDQFPVFLKPEWGQNGHGIHRADDPDALRHLRARLSTEPQRYILQEAAEGTREFEIFSINAARGNHVDSQHDVLTITEAVNGSEPFPINSKYNHNTRYRDITDQFGAADVARLAAYLREVGCFAISRMSVRCNSHEDLVSGNFKIIEINLFLPMPINLLDSNYTWPQRLRFIGSTMMSLARATKAIVPVEKPQPIFTRMMMYGRGKQTADLKKRKLDTRRTIL